jgi:Uma2 family endonuclease
LSEENILEVMEEKTMTFLSSINLPDHTQLPESDGTFVQNFQEHPQSILLTDSIRATLEKLHPDANYCIGQDSGIYWRIAEPLHEGAKAPDWFYVPNVPPTLDGKPRRSYVMWKEYVSPLIVIEFVSGNGEEERDKMAPSQVTEGGKVGKFWVYEQAIRASYYAIYEVEKAQVEVYCLVGHSYQLIPPNSRGHYPIPPMGVELGIWQGNYQNMTLPWLRWWDSQGNLLPTSIESLDIEKQKVELERQRAEVESQRADAESQRADAEKQKRLAITEKLRSLSAEQLQNLGIEMDML